jgi:ribosome-associated translation inhibitor RaiA
VETDHHKTKGNLFEVHVDLHIPGHEIVATQNANVDAYAAIHAAFEVATRQLEHVMHKQRGEVKAHRDDRGDNPRP